MIRLIPSPRFVINIDFIIKSDPGILSDFILGNFLVERNLEFPALPKGSVDFPFGVQAGRRRTEQIQHLAQAFLVVTFLLGSVCLGLRGAASPRSGARFVFQVYPLPHKLAQVVALVFIWLEQVLSDQVVVVGHAIDARFFHLGFVNFQFGSLIKIVRKAFQYVSVECQSASICI